MIELRTLGTLDVRDAGDGRALQSVLAQPKRAAFLAYLALSGPGRFHRRDTLLGVFWPESTEKHARHSLSQAVYVLRRALGTEAIVTRSEEEIALSFDGLTCDAIEFTDRLERGELEAALQLYGGELLPGLHLGDSVEFERWLSAERLRLQVAAVTATRALAVACERDGNVVGAVRWLRRAVELAPFDEALGRELMARLDRAGDRPGALLEYDALARRLTRELEMEPSAESQALARAIRSRPERTPVEPPPAREDAHGADAALPIRAPRERPRGIRRRTLRYALLVPALMLVGAAPVLVWRSAEPASVAGAAADRIAVLPFDVRGRADLGYLGEGLALLLSARLDGAGPLRGVDPDAVLDFVDAQGGAHGVELGRAVTRRFDAGHYTSGTVVEAGGRLSVQVGLYDADGTLRAQASADAADEAGIFSVVDELARTLIASRYGTQADRLSRIAAQTTLSLPALKEYLAGERAFRRGRFAEAASAFERAAIADSTFALAHYRLSLASLWADVPDTLPFDADARALRHADRLSEHDHQLLVAYDAWRRGDANEAERIYLNVLAIYPDDAEAALQLGETLFHYNATRGRSPSEARAPFERVVHLDPDNWSALWHLLLIAGTDRRAAAFDELARRLASLEAEPAQSLELRSLVAFAHRDEESIAALMPELRAAHALQVLDIAWRIAIHAHDPAGARRVARLGTTTDRHAYSRQMAHVQLAYLEMALGRDSAAAYELDRIGDIGAAPASDAARVFLLTLPLRTPDRAALTRVRADLASRRYKPDEQSAVVPRPHLVGTLDLALGDTAAALASADVVDRLARAEGMLEGTHPLAEALRAEVAARGGRPSEAVRRHESARMNRWFGWAASSPVLSATQPRWLQAEVLRALGRHDEALGFYAAFADNTAHDLAYHAPSLLRRAGIHELRGEPAEAARCYAELIALWSGADPALQPVVEQARARLAALAPAD